MAKKFDFTGWATKNGIRCSDGLTIIENAFAHNDGAKVPLVWNHQHNEAHNVLGYAVLENRKEGVLCHGSFNDTDEGCTAKRLLEHGDIGSLSIYANHLSKRGNDVIHGNICEVSLVLAGANPGATIFTTSLEHSDDGKCYEEAIINFGEEEVTLCEDEEVVEHAAPAAPAAEKATDDAGSDKTIGEIFDAMSEEKRKVAEFLIGEAINQMSGKGSSVKTMAHADAEGSSGNNDERTVGDVMDTFTEEEKMAIAYVIAEATKDLDTETDNEENTKENTKGEKEMSHNAFDQNDAKEYEGEVLTHSDMVAIFNDVEKYGTLKKSALEHGITNIDYLFPDAKNIQNTPVWLNNKSEWVSAVMNGVSHSPMSRIRTQYADITADNARAKGYQKGHQKLEEVFEVLKRTTDPQTIYKKQELHKDDIRDIVDFDVVAWVKGEMRVKLEEELARAILIGDGRSTSSDDKIYENHIRSIWNDDEVYTIHHDVVVSSSATDDQKADAIITGAVKSRIGYKGSGNVTLFTTETWLTSMLLMKDSIGHRLYKTEAELATAMRVKTIVTVPQMENISRVVNGTTKYLVGILVNLNDYTVGADKGGKTELFEDFDIDYNKEKYLLETRCSGALKIPKAAIALELSFQ